MDQRGSFPLLELVVTSALLGAGLALGGAWVAQRWTGELSARAWAIVGFAGILFPIAAIALVDWIDKR